MVPADSLVFSERTTSGFRFARARVTEELCLVCHGETLAPAVQASLKRLYPEDSAMGYGGGVIRGIFSLTYVP